jgi:hypothetical protein
MQTPQPKPYRHVFTVGLTVHHAVVHPPEPGQRGGLIELWSTRRLDVVRYDGPRVERGGKEATALHDHLVDALFAARAAWGA